MFKGTPSDKAERDITPRYSFKDFIQTEMGEKDFNIY